MSGSNYMPPYFPSRAETALYRDLLRECAEVLREDIEGGGVWTATGAAAAPDTPSTGTNHAAIAPRCATC